MPFLVNGSSLFQWLESSGIAHFFRQSIWVYPAVEIIHIAGFAVLVGSAFLFDLRLLGLARKLPVKEILRHLIFWARMSLLAVIPSGFILFMVDASSLASNPAFRVKLVLIVFAGLNAWYFHHYTFKSIDEWNTHRMPPFTARVAGIVSIVLWFSVIACGRLIAYL